jgi:hypothetical protein
MRSITQSIMQSVLRAPLMYYACILLLMYHACIPLLITQSVLRAPLMYYACILLLMYHACIPLLITQSVLRAPLQQLNSKTHASAVHGNTATRLNHYTP